MENNIEYNMFYSAQNGLNFSCGDMFCWEIKGGYQTARLVDGCYVEQKPCTVLEDALLRLRKGGKS